MLGLAGLPSFVMFVGLIFMPESPRWLVFKGKENKARSVLAKVRQRHEVEAELKTIVRDHEEHMKSQKSELMERTKGEGGTGMARERREGREGGREGGRERE